MNMTKWQKGQSGNPKGRPKGTRDAINKAFIDDVAQDWREHGLEALQRAREERPAEYVRMVASLLPKEAAMRVDVHTKVDEAFYEALKAMGKHHKIIDGEAKKVEETKALPKNPKSD
jgi:hypothetical protein